MIEFLQHALAFIVAIGVLITFHEFGHFWVARRCDVKILRFSIGFGWPLFMRHFGRDRTEFVIAALPLGGYVKMLDEREGDVPAAERHRAFNRKPLRDRAAIVLAGPLFNFLFAVIAYWLMFIVGIPGLKPVIDDVRPGSVAADAGFRPADEILAVGARRTPTWGAVADEIVGEIVAGRAARVTVRDTSGEKRELLLNLARIPVDDIADGALLERLGLRPLRPILPAVIGEVVPGGAAERAGMQAGDMVLSADGEAIRDWPHWVEYVRSRPEVVITAEIRRGDELITLLIVPEAAAGENGERIGRIGASVDRNVAVPAELLAMESYAPHVALWKGIERTGEMSVLTLRVLGKIVLGEASVKNLSGPISIAQYAGYSAAVGLAAFLGFLGIVSVSLGVLNLLPIPLLDGGHLMYYLIESIKGSPVSDAAQSIGQQIGLALLLGLMTLVIYNDIVRLIG